MRVYFSQVDKKEAEAYGGEFFEQDGRLYDYEVSITDDGFKVADAVGRKVPFSYEDIIPLMRALAHIERPCTILGEAQRVMDELESTDIAITI